MVTAVGAPVLHRLAAGAVVTSVGLLAVPQAPWMGAARVVTATLATLLGLPAASLATKYSS